MIPASENYAGIGGRCVAYATDVLILFGVLSAFQALLYKVNPLLRQDQAPKGPELHLWVLVTVSLPVVLYFVICYRSCWQATIGMKLLKLSVTDMSGGPLGFWQAVLRAFVLLIPFELNHVVMFYPIPITSELAPRFRYGFIAVMMLMLLYLGAILLTQNHQSIHDLVARTLVLRSS